MEQKINITELLKDCPKGMELDCTIFDAKVTYKGIIERIPDYPIVVQTEHGLEFELTQYGQLHNFVGAKCVIYPKDKTTWEGFVPPCKFKDGDVVFVDAGIDYRYVVILKRIENNSVYDYCVHYAGDKFSTYNCLCEMADVINMRLATEEEKEKLFKAIKDNGYKWNAETKTLEKLVKDKFDINTLVPFESKVLVRDGQTKWLPAIWGFYNEDNSSYPYGVVGGGSFNYCIPYNGNEHLRGTTNDCDDYYKNWE